MSTFNSPDIWLYLTRLAILLFTAFIAWLTYRSHLLIQEFRPDFNVLLSLPESIARIFMVGICLFLAWLSGLSAQRLGLTVANFWQSIILGLAIGVGTQLVVYGVTIQLIKRFGRQIYSPWLIRNILPRRPIDWLFIGLAFIPPIAMEELLFRTLLIGVFQDMLPLWLLIGVTSIVFGLMHQPQGRLGTIMAGVINILFCLVFVWSGELLITFVAHYAVNFLQVTVAHFQQDWLEHYDPYTPIDKSNLE